jgi:hypothetical protein
MTWWAAGLRAAVMLVIAVLFFVVVPDRLLAYLSLHIVPFWRDVAMICYTGLAFVAACVVFVRVQGVRE